MSGFDPVQPKLVDPKASPAPTDELRHGRPDGEPDVRLLGGYFIFDSADADLLVSLLPAMVHVRAGGRLSTLVHLVRDETITEMAGRDLVLSRLAEVMLIEALRTIQGKTAPAGLLRALGDARVAVAIREMHADPGRAWTVEELAGKAALSRSAFFDRFKRAVEMSPIEYLLGWRMAIAKNLLRHHDVSLAEIAERVGYSSTSTFSTAFSRHVGQPPSHFARERADIAAG